MGDQPGIRRPQRPQQKSLGHMLALPLQVRGNHFDHLVNLPRLLGINMGAANANAKGTGLGRSPL